MTYDSTRQAGTEKTEFYKGRGVWVPDGLDAKDIMVGAKALEDGFDVAPYESRDMVRVVLTALLQANDPATDPS